MSANHRAIPWRTWARIRRRVLERDAFRCVRCKRPGRLEVDHVIAIDHGGDPVDPANLQTLCRVCHVEKTAGEFDSIGSERRAWRALLNALVYENVLTR